MGRAVAGEVVATLEARAAAWYPWGEDGQGLRAHVFALPGERARVPGPATRFMVNGRSWPNTERLDYSGGDTVRWRVINMTGREHPMHLHGFYFHVDARGDQTGDVAYAPAGSAGYRPSRATGSSTVTSCVTCRGSRRAMCARRWRRTRTPRRPTVS